MLVPRREETGSISGAEALPSVLMDVDATLHHPRREQRLAFVLCQHVLFVAARAQHQEAERPHHGDDHQGQKHVLPAVVCERKVTTQVLPAHSTCVVIATHGQVGLTLPGIAVLPFHSK